MSRDTRIEKLKYISLFLIHHPSFIRPCNRLQCTLDCVRSLDNLTSWSFTYNSFTLVWPVCVWEHGIEQDKRRCGPNSWIYQLLRMGYSHDYNISIHSFGEYWESSSSEQKCFCIPYITRVSWPRLILEMCSEFEIPFASIVLACCTLPNLLA